MTAATASPESIAAMHVTTDVSPEQWNAYVQSRPDASVYHLAEWATLEQLTTKAKEGLAPALEAAKETLLPHLSPGCGHWDLADQHRLMALLTGEEGGTMLGPVQLLPSGALRPQHSGLAALGVTHRTFANTPEALCRSCDLDPCAFRRAPQETR